MTTHMEGITAAVTRNVADRLPLLLGRLVEGCWLGVGGLVPLFFIPGLLRPFYPPKAMLLQFFALVILAAVVARWLLDGRGVTGADVRSFLRSRLHLAVLAFAATAIIATILSLSPWTSLAGSVNRREGLLTILSWVVVFLVLSTHLRTLVQLRRLIIVLLASSGLVSIIGIIEHYVPSFSHWFLSTTYTSRVAATTGNALSLSGYLGMAIPFTLATGLLVHRRRGEFARSRRMLVALGALLAIQLWSLVLSTYSFVLLLYLLPVVLFVAVFTLLEVKRRSVTLAALGLLLALIIGGAAIVLPQWQNAVAGTPEYAYALEQSAPSTPAGRAPGAVYYRARNWLHVADIITEAVSDPQPGDSTPWLRPLIGYGPQTFFITVQRHSPPEYAAASTYRAEMYDDPHNHYLHLATTVGLLGLALWLALVVGCGVTLYRLLRRTGTASPPALYALAAGCAAAGFLAHAVFNPIALAEEALFWPCLGLIPALAVLQNARTDTSAPHGQPDSRPASPRFRTALALLLVVVAVAGGTMAARNPLMAEVAIRDAIVMSASGNPNTVFMYSLATELQPHESTYWGALGGYAHSIALRARGEAQVTVLELSLIALRQARNNQPLLAFWHYQLGDALLYAASSTGQVTVEDALASYGRALELWPRNAVLANRVAVAHMVGGDLAGAALALQAAADFDPAWTQTVHLKAVLAALTGEGTRGSQSLLRLIRESPGELQTFAQVAASQLAAYELVEPAATVMLPAIEQENDWAGLALRGVLTAMTGDPAAAASFLTAAIQSVPEDALEAVQDTASYLGTFAPGLREALTS